MLSEGLKCLGSPPPPPWLLALKRGFFKCLDAYHVVSACISLVLLKTKFVKIALKIAGLHDPMIFMRA